MSFLVFPRELIDSIVDDIRELGDGDSTLRNFAVTCKDISAVCRPLLFETLTISSGQDHTALLSAFRNDEAVSSMVHNVCVELSTQDFDPAFQHTSASRVLQKLSNVRKLQLSPTSREGSRCRVKAQQFDSSLEPIKSLVPVLSTNTLVSLSIVYFSLPSSIFSICTNLKELHIHMGCIVESPVKHSTTSDVQRPRLDVLSINHAAQSRWPVPGAYRYTAADDNLAFPDLKNLRHLKACFPDHILRSIIDEPEALTSLYLQVREHNLDKLDTFLSKELFRSTPHKLRTLRNLTIEVLSGLDLDSNNNGDIRGFRLEEALRKLVRPWSTSLKNVERFEFIGVIRPLRTYYHYQPASSIPHLSISQDFAHTFLESLGTSPGTGSTLTDFDIKIKSELASFVPPSFNLHPRVAQDSFSRFKASEEQEAIVKDVFAAAGIRFNVHYGTQ
ncbi:hypothetical protein MD484_g8515, partial [Candolleomyces efflorescens]